MEDGDDDVELGVGVGGHSTRDEEGLGPQESGVMNLEQEVDNWDENAVDNWDDDDGPGPSEHDDSPPSYQEGHKASIGSAGPTAGDAAGKRAD